MQEDDAGTITRKNEEEKRIPLETRTAGVLKLGGERSTWLEKDIVNMVIGKVARDAASTLDRIIGYER